MKIKSLIVELTIEEIVALSKLLGNLTDSDYLKFAETQKNVEALKTTWSHIVPIADLLDIRNAED